MKKILKYAFGLLAVLAVGCSDETQDVLSRSVTLYASDAECSRTSFDYDAASGGYHTSWSEDDAMRVLIASGGEAKEYLFTLQDAASGRFACAEVEDATVAVDAYGVYPSTAQVASDLTAIVEVGAAEQSQMAQTSSHVAKYDPLWGGVQSVDLDAIRLQMHHTAAVMQFSMKNMTDAAVDVESVKLYAPTPVAGEYSLNLQSGELTATENVSKAIELSFADCNIAAGEEAKAWVAMSPFVVNAGDELKFVVTTADGKHYSYTKSFAAEVEFPLGKVMTMSAPIVLSAESLMAESRSVEVDLTKEATYPENFPTSKTLYEAEDATEYELGGEKFKLFTTQYYACGGAYDKLRFYFNGANGSTKPKSTDYALLYLPYFEGYKIAAVNVTLDGTIKKNSIIHLAIANPDNLEVSHAGSNSAQDTDFSSEVIVNEMGTDTSKECCLYMHFNGVSPLTTSCNCYITSITIDYVLE